MPIVKCSVSNCTYWGEDNNCIADLIMVEIDRHSKKDFKAEFTGEFAYDTRHQDAAVSSAETCCHTFTPKQS
ncbi:DUF1540 domain-containing protein [Brevibacillus massiliensis]|uniref:DUF1540 domain-containing protein n=1 Tax=Brevibacillus massiliensis TaxID=1118054 RepID=UPI00031C0EAA|nr:DUF1540 domain-containing protein [Brevibacillus massiliensis]